MYEQEEWRPVVELSGYEVSSAGRIRSLRHGTPFLVATHQHRSGHLYFNGDRTRSVHAAVAEAFHGERPAGAVCRHLNGNPSDNRAENLAWGSPSDNEYDKVRHGSHPQARRTACSNGHAYDDANTYRRPNGHRDCRACIRRRAAAYKNRRALRAASVPTSAAA